MIKIIRKFEEETPSRTRRTTNRIRTISDIRKIRFLAIVATRDVERNVARSSGIGIVSERMFRRCLATIKFLALSNSSLLHSRKITPTPLVAIFFWLFDTRSLFHSARNPSKVSPFLSLSSIFNPGDRGLRNPPLFPFSTPRDFETRWLNSHFLARIPAPRWNIFVIFRTLETKYVHVGLCIKISIIEKFRFNSVLVHPSREIFEIPFYVVINKKRTTILIKFRI